jgi:hypothetical protein
MGVKVVVILVADLFHHFLGAEKTTTRFLCCPRDVQITRWECQSLKSWRTARRKVYDRNQREKSEAGSGQSLPYMFVVKRKCPCNRPWRPIGLWDVEDPTIDTQVAGRLVLRVGRPLPPEKFLVLISVRGSHPQGHIAAGNISVIAKNPMVSSGIEPATFWLVA